MDKQIYQLFILIYFDMFRIYLVRLFFSFCFIWCKQQTVVEFPFFSMLFFFLSKKNQLLSFSFSFFLYNISGDLEWCVCVYVYLSLLRSFPLWPCCVGSFFFFLIYIYFFSLHTFCAH
jgi:hypothetical protein